MGAPVPHAKPHSGPDALTQKRILRWCPHEKPHSGPDALTQKRILRWCPHEKPHSGLDPSRKSALRVIGTMQSAPFGNATPAECVFP